MMRKIFGVFGLLSQEVRGLQRAASILAGAAFLSSILALLRDRYFAYVFGAGATLDVYYAAFRIPDLIFVATGALVSIYILIPELTRRSEEDQKYYLDTILVGFSLFSVVASALAALLAPATTNAGNNAASRAGASKAAKALATTENNENPTRIVSR